MPRDLTVLGTSSATPTRTRNHPGLFFRLDGLGVLVDPGEGTQRQMIHAGVSPASVDLIWLTHVHGDHCFGLPGLLNRLALNQSAPVTLVHPAAGDSVVDALLTAGVGGHLVGERIRVGSGAGEDVVDCGDWTLRAVPLSHRIPAYGLLAVENDGVQVDVLAAERLGITGPLVGTLLRDGELFHNGRHVHRDQVALPRRGQRAAVVMDTRMCDGAEELADGCDLLVTESTFLSADRELADEYAHLTAAEAGRLAAGGGVKQLVLQHYSQRYPDEQVFAAEAAEHFPDVVAAVDLQRIDMPQRDGARHRGRVVGGD